MIKVIKILLPNTLKWVEVKLIGDLHFESPECRIDDFKQLVDYIEKNETCYAILNGDMLDNAIIGSKGDHYRQRHSIEDSIDELVKILTPIKHKILAIDTGNHEGRTTKAVGIDITKTIAMRLGIEDKYSKEGYVLIVRYKEKKFSFYNRHGSGGGGTMGSKANALLKNKDIVSNVDVYFMSHIHQALMFPKGAYFLDENTDDVKYKESLFVSNSAFLDFGGYGHDMGFSPPSKSNPYIKLFVENDKKSIKLNLTTSNE